jgi:hypothetical protein
VPPPRAAEPAPVATAPTVCGTTRTIVQDTEPAWRPGDQVRLIGNEIRSAS